NYVEGVMNKPARYRWDIQWWILHPRQWHSLWNNRRWNGGQFTLRLIVLDTWNHFRGKYKEE
ncbi:MAG: hypothetical protein J3T61_09695, partial [Candidatus Brocadiales bacterium]|nr:hypothetical protein [Candidatus Bathyanammoxibius sp.]